MRNWLFVAAILGGLSVLCGAFAAHGLSGRLDAASLALFETAARYQMYHALAMGLAGLLLRTTPSRQAQAAALLFLIGTALFCGSLYLLVFTGIKMLGAVTPLGGLAFVAGWVLLALAALKKP